MSSHRSRKRRKLLKKEQYNQALRVYYEQSTGNRQLHQLTAMAHRLTQRAKNRIEQYTDTATGVTVRQLVRDVFGVIKKPDGSAGFGISKKVILSEPYRTVGLSALIPNIDPSITLEVNAKSGKLIHFMNGKAPSIKSWGNLAIHWGNTGTFVTIQKNQTDGTVTRTLATYTFGIKRKPDGSSDPAVTARDIVQEITTIGLVAYSARFTPSLEGSHKYDQTADRVSISAEGATFANAGKDTRAIFVPSPKHPIFAQSAALSDNQVTGAQDTAFSVQYAEVDLQSGGIVTLTQQYRPQLKGQYYKPDPTQQYLLVTRHEIAGIEPRVAADYVAQKLALVSRVTGASPDTFIVQMGYKAAGPDTQTVPTHIEPGNPGIGQQRVEAWTSLARPGKNDGLLYFLPGTNQTGPVARTDPGMVALDASHIGIYKGYAGERGESIGYNGYSVQPPVFINRSPPNGMVHVDNNLLGPDRQPQGGLRIRFQSNRAPA